MAGATFIFRLLALLTTLSPVIGRSETQIPIHISSHDASPLNLNFSSPAPHLFHATVSLLQQLPNTVFPNGHTLAAVTIPPYTLFYHARRDRDAPASPEWVAFDPDMSYGIMGGHRNVWLRTLQTTRPVRALYFDGESGNLQGLGQFDAQMLLLYGNVTGPEGMDELEREYARAQGLCDWLLSAELRGRGWGFEGVVRMNAGFEMIWCDFASESLRTVSHVNVTAPLLPSDGPPPDDSVDQPAREPFIRTRSWNWFDSATWHYGSSGLGSQVGETRARIESCGTLSFYARQFANASLHRAVEERSMLNLTKSGLWKGPGEEGNRTGALTELRRRRRFHHLEYASRAEAQMMRDSAERALKGLLEEGSCSGADWGLMAGEIVQRTSKHIRDFAKVLASSPASDSKGDILDWLHGLRSFSHLFMVYYVQYPAEQDASAWSTRSQRFNDTLKFCRTRYTALMDEMRLTPEEAEQKWAIEETFGTICLVQLTIGFGIEQTWAEAFDSGFSASRSELSARVQRWRSQLDELTAWLGWENEFLACKEVCAADERCYIPMWPITRPKDAKRTSASALAPGELLGERGLGQGKTSTMRRPWVHTEEEDLWEPKCVKEVCIEGLC